MPVVRAPDLNKFTSRFPPTADTFIVENTTLMHLAWRAWKAHTPTAPSGIASCANLAIAHTGSTWLHEALLPLSPYAHHQHFWLIPSLYAMGIRCFVATVRDPVQRLVSAFNFDLKRHGGGQLAQRNYAAMDPTEFVQKLRGALNRSQGALSTSEQNVLHRWQAARLGLGNPLTDADRGPWGATGREDGFFALLPQVRYFLGLAAHADVELHFLCTRQLVSDWQRLLFSGPPVMTVAREAPRMPTWQLGLNRSSWARSQVPVTQLLADQQAQWNRTTNGADAHRSWKGQLSADDASFVRDTMYPEDTWLERHICEPLHSQMHRGVPHDARHHELTNLAWLPSPTA